MADFKVSEFSTYNKCRKHAVSKWKIGEEFFNHIWLEYISDLNRKNNGSGLGVLRKYPRDIATLLNELVKLKEAEEQDLESRFYRHPELFDKKESGK